MSWDICGFFMSIYILYVAISALSVRHPASRGASSTSSANSMPRSSSGTVHCIRVPPRQPRRAIFPCQRDNTIRFAGCAYGSQVFIYRHNRGRILYAPARSTADASLPLTLFVHRGTPSVCPSTQLLVRSQGNNPGKHNSRKESKHSALELFASPTKSYYLYLVYVEVSIVARFVNPIYSKTHIAI